MPRVQSEYEVEIKFIERLESIGYRYLDLKDYDDVIANARTQLAAFNAKKLSEAKGSPTFSDAEWNRVMIHLDNHSVYESAKILRDKYVLMLDDNEYKKPFPTRFTEKLRIEGISNFFNMK